MHFVYILQSQKDGRFYIGQTADTSSRLAFHNRGGVKATKNLRPLILVYTEEHPDATAARKREWQLKQLKSRRMIEVY